jgi:hypothetical protein
MDQLKVVLEAIKKHHFWVLNGLIVVVTLTLWALATSELAGSYRQRATKLDGSFAAMTGICGQPAHPNQNVVDEVKKRTTDLKWNVLESWQKLYDEQKANNVLPDALTADFKNAFENLEPGAELDNWHREEYQNFIQDHFADLFQSKLDVVRDAPRVDGQSGGSDQTEKIGLVEWVEADRARIVEQFKWPRTPTTQEVVDAQEDLWVYEALASIIKKTNEPETRRNLVPIKRIDTIQIGKGVVEEGTQVATSTTQPGERTSRQPGRYVDDAGSPLSPSGEPPVYPHPYAEFKMMPIRMKLVMDPTKIPKLLAQCANSSMPVEVRRVRFRPGESGAPVSGQPQGAAGGASWASSANALRRGPRGPAVAGTEQSVFHPQDAPVEIRGIICIYNPPDVEKLGTGKAAEQRATESPAAAPASTPAPTAPQTSPPAAAATPRSRPTPAGQSHTVG